MLNPISNLLDAVAYEKYFLEQVYRLAVGYNSSDIEIELSYTADGEPHRKGFGRACIDLADWRPGFITAGRPLIFITAFKVLDSIFDWLIKTPSKDAPNQVDQKLDALKKIPTDKLPELFRSETWLFERVVALYKRTAHLRNTLIHRGDFEACAAGLHVRLGKIQSESERTAISNVAVASFADLALTMIRLITGISTFDTLNRKRTRWLFDNLISLHEQPLLGQQKVQFGRVVLAFPKFGDLAFDLSRLREDISPIMSISDTQGNVVTLKYDTVFELRIIIGDATVTTDEYLISYRDLDKYPMGISREQLLEYKWPT